MQWRTSPLLGLFFLAGVNAMGWPEPPVDLSLSRRTTGTEGGDSSLKRSRSQVWFEGYKAGCMQFLQSYIPDQRDGKPLVIGVAGGSGSGKTTIKDVLVEQLSMENVAVLPHDNYYRHRPDLSDEERDQINFDHPESLETELMVEHLKQLLEGKSVKIPVYDFATHLRKTDETRLIEPRPIILVEGILILQNELLLPLMHLRVYVDVEADRRLIRRIDRDMLERGRSFASIVHQYLSTVKPMHDMFVEPSKHNADLIIPFGGRNVAAIQVLLERLKTHLRNSRFYSASKQAEAGEDPSEAAELVNSLPINHNLDGTEQSLARSLDRFGRAPTREMSGSLPHLHHSDSDSKRL
mmetsp:Transcript_40871/g.81879  ORF Transcript_40871/g.81879 Transcript_40871/m.81879 type:complete len:352 (-) Transcript_40871:24-1079(-)